MNPWARIVIVDYKSGPHLQRCITALEAQTDRDFEVVIVDNACPEGAARALRLTDDRFEVATSPDNTGFAGGCNFGARKARADWIITLNPDASPAPDWIAEMKAASLRHPKFDMLGATLFTDETPARVDGFGDAYSWFGIAWRSGHGQSLDLLPKNDCEVFAPCGAASAYRRSLFEALGGFDEAFFCYLEDIDLAWRARIRGSACMQVRRARTVHVGSVSTADDPSFRVYHSTRNGWRMMARNAPVLALLAMLPLYLASQMFMALKARDPAARKARLKGIAFCASQLGGGWQARRPVRAGSRWTPMGWAVLNPLKVMRKAIVNRKLL